MRASKEKKRLEGEKPDYPAELPDLRRLIIVVDYDFGKTVHIMKLFKTSRIDCYRAVVDGKTWKTKIGWSKILEGLRKSFVRVHSVF